MTNRCEPPEELRGVDGWHWVKLPFVAVPTPMAWMTNPDNDEREWRMPSSPSFVSGESKTARSYRYLAPVTPPAEVEALRAELERERMRLAACGVVALSDTPDSAKLNRDMHPDYHSASCDDVARRVDEGIALRATVAQLREALEDLVDVQVLSKGWDNGVTDSTGTMNEGEYLHEKAFDRALDALAAAKGAGE